MVVGWPFTFVGPDGLDVPGWLGVLDFSDLPHPNANPRTVRMTESRTNFSLFKGSSIAEVYPNDGYGRRLLHLDRWLSTRAISPAHGVAQSVLRTIHYGLLCTEPKCGAANPANHSARRGPRSASCADKFLALFVTYEEINQASGTRKFVEMVLT